ncbi:MAG: hypothetical protein ACI88L_000191 [Candidatus Paceibacteria bacterium]|jgi:hypothetical protein
MRIKTLSLAIAILIIANNLVNGQMMNMGNAYIDSESNHVSIGFWFKPDPTDQFATGVATLKVGTSPDSINTIVAVKEISEVGNYSFEFDGNPFREVDKTVRLWFSMDGENSNGGYSKFPAINWVMLPPLQEK